MGDIPDYERFINQLKTCILNSRLYPTTSPVVQSGYDTLLDALAPCLSVLPEMTINDIEGKIYINEKTPLPRAELRPIMFAHDVQTLAFDRGCSRDELGCLVEGLGKRKSDLGPDATLKQWLIDQGCSHVRVEEFQFVAVKKGDDIARQVRLLFNQKHDSFADVLKSMENALRLMQSTDDVSARNQIHTQMVEQIAHLPPALLRDFFEKPLSEDLQHLPLRQQVLETLTPEILQRFMADVPAWMAQIRGESFSPAIRQDRESRLKEILLRLRQTPAAAALPEAIFTEALAAFHDEGVSVSLSPAEQARHRTTMAAADLLAAAFAPTWTPLINGLCLMRSYQDLSSLARRLAENFHSENASLRLGAAKLLRSIFETTAANRAEEHLDAALEMLSQKLDGEMDAQAFSQMTQTLQVAASTELVRGRTERCLVWLGRLRLMAHPDTSPSEGHRHEAAKALTIFTQRAMEIIVDDTFAMNPPVQAAAGHILVSIGGPAVPALTAYVQRTPDPRLRQFAIQSMRRYPAETLQALQTQLTHKQTPETLLRLLPLVSLCPDPSLALPLSTLLRTSDAALRKEALRALSSIKDVEAENTLIAALDTDDASVQSGILKLIRDERIVSAGPELIRRLPSASPTIQQEICQTLADLQDKSAIPALLAVLDLQKMPWKSSSVPEPVRLKAAWALGVFASDPIVFKALELALKDKSIQIQAMAKAMLQRAGKPHA